MDYSNYTARINAWGSNARERIINHSRYKFDKSFNQDPSCKEHVEILNKGFVDIQMDGRRLIQGIPTMDIRAKLSEPVRFVAGDTFFYDDGYWLCTDSSTFHETYRKGVVEECNCLLRWQNPKTLNIVKKWCIVKSPYSSGVEENKSITVGNSKYKIKLPYDDETCMLNYDSRFLINLSRGNPIAYKLIDFDDATNKNEFRKDGFLVIVVEQDEGQTDDNKELMIANYKQPPASPTTTVGSCGIIYSGRSIIKAGGTPKTFTAVFYDSDGEPIPTIAPTWELMLPPELQNPDKIMILPQQENKIRLEAVGGDEIIGREFTLKVYANDGIYGYFETEIIITVNQLFS